MSEKKMMFLKYIKMLQSSSKETVIEMATLLDNYFKGDLKA